MKKILTIVALMLAFAQIFATTYTISSYSFDVTGKTKQKILSDFVQEPGATFDSEEDLVSFLDDKLQQLLNLRLFQSVDYTYTLTPNPAELTLEQPAISTPDTPEDSTEPTSYSVAVIFTVVDARTFIAVPYPKYDSNYGLRLKVKAEDTNLFGTFTTLDTSFVLTTRDNSFKESLIEWDLSLYDIKIGKTNISITQDGGIDLQKWDDSYIGAGFKFDNLEFWNIALSGAFDFSIAPLGEKTNSAWGPNQINGSFGILFKNPNLRNFALNSTISYIFKEQKLQSDTTFTYRYDVWGITSITQIQTTDYGIEIKNKPESKYTYPPEASQANASDPGTTPPPVVELGDVLPSLLSIGTGIERPFSLGSKGSINPRLMFYFAVHYKPYKLDAYIQFTLPVSYGRIDWVDNNFRKGILLSADASYAYHMLDKELLKMHVFSLSASAEVHYPVTTWFNPSAHLNLNLSTLPTPYNQSLDLSWNLRGIRDNNTAMKTDLMRTFAMTLNLDLMFNFIRIKNFCKTYANAFMDIFVGNNSDSNKIDTLFTIGLEGILVLDKLPSYPVRMSLGINAEDLIKWMKGGTQFSDIEWELYIGLYFLY